MEEESDHDLLIALCRDVTWLTDAMKNHLKHHWMLEIGLVIILAGAVAAKLWG